MRNDCAILDERNKPSQETRLSRLNANYFLLPLAAGHDRVELWSTTRPPFEPKGRLKDMRAELAGAVRQLQPGEDRVLYADYVSSVAGLCDVENVLFYNIGPGAFRSAMTNGVRFERSFSRPHATPSSMLEHPPHYQSYDMRDVEAGFVHWKVGAKAAEWEGVQLPALNSSTKVAAIWNAVKTATDSVWTARVVPGHFGLRIVVDVPDAAVDWSVSSFLKPVLDGLISAFHRHDGSDIAEISQRLSLQTGTRASDVATLLDGRELAALGTRQLVRRFMSNVQWNPRDDDCVACEVIVHPVPRERWSTSGALFEVAPA